MIVLDASATVEWLLRRPIGHAVDAILHDESTGSVHAPSLLGIEVSAALRRLVRGQKTTPARARLALAALGASDFELHDPTTLLPRVWELRDNLSPYDACYVALAEVLGAVLVTSDARIARAPGLRARVDVIS